LSFLEGEEIVLLEKVDKYKWKGEGAAGIGYFDSTKVRLKETGEITESIKPKKQLHLEFLKLEELEQKSHTKNLHANLIIPSKCVVFDDSNEESCHLVRLELLPPHPLLVFANPRSGGNRGAVLIKYFNRLINPIQVFDISKGGPEKGLKLFSVCKTFRILVCGGDGTVAWVQHHVHALEISTKCSVAILPLGTGNDLSRVLGWGPGFDGGNISRVLSKVEDAEIKLIDRWNVRITKADGTFFDREMNNYFSIGFGAKLAYDFNEWRNKNQKLFSTRTMNKAAYAFDGFKDSIVHSCKDMQKKISASVNNETLTLPTHEELILLNIPSYGGGMDLWGTPKGVKFGQASMNDKKFEMLTVEGSLHMGRIKVGLGHADRIKQASQLVIKSLEDLEFPIQVDGEAEMVHFKEISITHINQVSMLRYNPPPHWFKNFFKAGSFIE